MHQLDNPTVNKIITSIFAQGLNENEIEGTNENREMEIIRDDQHWLHCYAELQSTKSFIVLKQSTKTNID